MEVIPFGKYKGKPVEILQSDRQYTDWLVSQDWFRNRYPQINQVIINNFGEPTETPEHNRIQALFTDDDFVHKFISHFYKGYHIQETQVAFETSTCDVYIDTTVLKHKDQIPALGNWKSFRIEIKPVIGDDYPAILRQIKSYVNDSNDYIVLYEQFNSIGATLDQVKKIFKPHILINVGDIV